MNKIDICEILRGFEGIELYTDHFNWGRCIFLRIDKHLNSVVVEVPDQGGPFCFAFDKYGELRESDGSVSHLYPSKDEKDWSKFERPKTGDSPTIVSTINHVYEMMKEMNFGGAIEALKQGKKVARKGWNGKGQYVYYVPAAKYKWQTENAKEIADKDGMVSYREYMALKTVQGDIATWVPSVSDCLAEDWVIVE